ncbi:MAG: von Willebrand factor type A domain-containing protein [Chitinophagaceae bacterium]
MKAVCRILFCLLIGSPAFSQQFYLRGEVRDESNIPLQNVTILNTKTGYVYKSGATGAFGIVTNNKVDTFNFTLSGYRPERVAVNADVYLNLKLKLLPAGSSASNAGKLASIVKGMVREDRRQWYTGDESYASILENNFVNSSRFPNTGLSLNVDRASYSNIRRFLATATMVPPDAVRVEEMLNYFNLSYTPPPAKDLFHLRTRITSCPWNLSNQLFFVNLSAKKLDLEALPPSNLVFLIDVSGSMDMTNRLPLLKAAFRMLVANLRAKDSVAIVAYGGNTGVMLQTTSGAEKDSILKAVDELTPGGSTPGEAGIRYAYLLAAQHFIPGGNNRVILATDGDFNVGLRTEDELDELISRHSASGIYLTCLGVGMGNYKDSKIQTLARKGNGNFAYLDNFREAEKVMMHEFTQTMYSVADNAYMSVEFNPGYVKQYRLIGFDNRVGALNDYNAVVEGGEIGSGYSMMGIFEIEPVNRDTTVIERFANIRVNYNEPGDSINKCATFRVPYDYEPFATAEQTYRFAGALAQFGQMLRGSAATKFISWNDMLLLATSTADPANPSQQEFVLMVQQAKQLYMKTKKKKKPESGE